MEISDQALIELLKARNAPQSGAPKGTSVEPSKNINSADPAERAKAQDEYVGQLLDQPASQWNEKERGEVRGAVNTWLKSNGY